MAVTREARLLPVLSSWSPARRPQPCDITVGGPELAQHAFHASLVDEVHLFVFPHRCGGRQARPAPGRSGGP